MLLEPFKMKNKKILILFLIFGIFINGCINNQKWEPSECPTYGILVYNGDEYITDGEKAKELFTRYSFNENPTLLQQSEISEMAYGSDKTFDGKEVNGWRPLPHKNFIVTKDGRVYLFAACE